jgi:7,8-dihydroneopterin aldolase/epimerase/oxygenase
VQELSAGRKFFLIEALAGSIADTILERYPQIERVTVTVRKPSAPIPASLSYVGVKVSRGREQ